MDRETQVLLAFITGYSCITCYETTVLAHYRTTTDVHTHIRTHARTPSRTPTYARTGCSHAPAHIQKHKHVLTNAQRPRGQIAHLIIKLCFLNRLLLQKMLSGAPFFFLYERVPPGPALRTLAYGSTSGDYILLIFRATLKQKCPNLPAVIPYLRSCRNSGGLLVNFFGVSELQVRGVLFLHRKSFHIFLHASEKKEKNTWPIFFSHLCLFT